MAYTVVKTKEESLKQLTLLVESFHKAYAGVKKTDYKEMALRSDFINPFLKTLGWDVENEAGSSQFLRNVLQEETIEVEDKGDVIAKKNPDYTLRIRGDRKLFVEAKKVSIDIENSIPSAFQVRRYGWNATLGISILTNFENLVIYDCRYKPQAGDDPSIARYQTIHYTEYVKNFDKIYDLISYSAVAAGSIDDYFSLKAPDLNTFDDFFLNRIEDWRYRLATEVVDSNVGFTEEDINFLIQRLLNRIVFLRICEDREIEKVDTLKGIKDYDSLKQLFQESDKKYNSGLFDFVEDHFSMAITLKSEILVGIFKELYYPESSYDFSVVDPGILSQIYERYLGSKISINDQQKISIIEEHEVAASDGVVSTPKIIVDQIVRETLEPVLAGKNLGQILEVKIADICCGSGTFLISVFDYLVEHIILATIQEEIKDKEWINDSYDGTAFLTLKAKQQILQSTIFGVDINPYAVEVSKFSLFVKLLEHENASSVAHYLSTQHAKVLPDLNGNIKNGNSLVDDAFYNFNPKALHDNAVMYKIKPFNWSKEFDFLTKTKGFDAIVGNPPYIRIQNMVKYQAEEVKYYQSPDSEYTVAQKDTFDKYYLFIQRAVRLLNINGVLGYIVPNKFFIVKGGKSLRAFITSQASLHKIIHFGVTQVFPGRSTYTAVLIVEKKQRNEFSFKRVKKIASEFLAEGQPYVSYNSADYQEDPWIFVSKATETVFEKTRNAGTVPLVTVAEIPVGLQNSKDEVYIFQPHSETATQDAHGVLTGFMEIGADITARKEAEQGRRAAESELRTMLDEFPGYVARASEDFHYEYANQRFAALFGLTPEQVPGRHSRDLLGEAGYEATRLRREQIVASGRPINFERHFETSAGDAGLDLLVTHFMVESVRPGGQRKFYQFAIDISERKRAERALEARDKELSAARDEAERANAAKSGFLSGVSHELRTPLNAILGFGQLLELEVREAEPADYVQEIMRAGRHLLELINEVLDLARVESGRFTISLESVPVLPMIEECLMLIRPLAEARGLHIVGADQDCGGHVLADRTRLKQVLLNLLSNAVKYNRLQGTIGIACVLEGDSVQIRISDTGPGLRRPRRRRWPWPGCCRAGRTWSIPGTRHRRRLEENLDAVDLVLAPADLAELEPLAAMVAGDRYQPAMMATVER